MYDQGWNWQVGDDAWIGRVSRSTGLDPREDCGRSGWVKRLDKVQKVPGWTLEKTVEELVGWRGWMRCRKSQARPWRRTWKN